MTNIDYPKEVYDLAKELIGGDPTEDDFAMARVLANLAFDAADGSREGAQALLDRITKETPAVHKLFARVGMVIKEADTAEKN